MLAYAADFWPLFWTIVGVAAGLTVLLTAIVAKFPARHSELVPVPVELTPVRSSDYERHARAA